MFVHIDYSEQLLESDIEMKQTKPELNYCV